MEPVFTEAKSHLTDGVQVGSSFRSFCRHLVEAQTYR